MNAGTFYKDTSIGQVRILDLIRENQVASVYRGFHVFLEQEVIVSFLSEELTRVPGCADRFLRDARNLVRIKHPALEHVIEGGEYRGRYYLVSDTPGGVSLRRVLREKGKFPFRKALEVITDVCRGLERASQDGIIHGNLTFGSIFIRVDGSVELRGLAFPSIDGTPGSISQNIRSLGRILYRMITGRDMHTQKRQDVSGGLQSVDSPHPGLSEPVASLIKRMTSLETGYGFESYESLIRTLERISFNNNSSHFPVLVFPEEKTDTGEELTLENEAEPGQNVISKGNPDTSPGRVLSLFVKAGKYGAELGKNSALLRKSPALFRRLVLILIIAVCGVIGYRYIRDTLYPKILDYSKEQPLQRQGVPSPEEKQFSAASALFRTGKFREAFSAFKQLAENGKTTQIRERSDIYLDKCREEMLSEIDQLESAPQPDFVKIENGYREFLDKFSNDQWNGNITARIKNIRERHAESVYNKIFSGKGLDVPEGEHAVAAVRKLSELSARYPDTGIGLKAENAIKRIYTENIDLEHTVDIEPNTRMVRLGMKIQTDFPTDDFTCKWKYGENVISAGLTAQHRFETEGTYQIVFELSAGGRNITSETIPVTIHPYRSREYFDSAFLKWKTWARNKLEKYKGESSQVYRLTLNDGRVLEGKSEGKRFRVDMEYGSLYVGRDEVSRIEKIDSRYSRFFKRLEDISDPSDIKAFARLAQRDFLFSDMREAVQWWQFFLEPDNLKFQKQFNVVNVCQTCNGKGKQLIQNTAPCKFCYGRKVVRCLVCQKTGKIPCPDKCMHGIIWKKEFVAGIWKEIKLKCQTCTGTGFITCDNCKGTGVVTCPSCKGTGRGPDIERPCPECGGKPYTLRALSEIPFPFR